MQPARGSTLACISHPRVTLTLTLALDDAHPRPGAANASPRPASAPGANPRTIRPRVSAKLQSSLITLGPRKAAVRRPQHGYKVQGTCVKSIGGGCWVHPTAGYVSCDDVRQSNTPSMLSSVPLSSTYSPKYSLWQRSMSAGTQTLCPGYRVVTGRRRPASCIVRR